MAVTSFKYAGTAANADRDGKPAWNNPDYAKTGDMISADCSIDKNDYSDWLRLTNFGFSSSDIPTGSTINGIEVEIWRRAPTPTSTISDSAIYLRKSTGQTGDNKASGDAWLLADITGKTYGGSTDMWGTSLTQSDITSSTFGIDLSAYYSGALSATATALVYYIRIRVYYTEGPPPVTRRIFITHQ